MALKFLRRFWLNIFQKRVRIQVPSFFPGILTNTVDDLFRDLRAGGFTVNFLKAFRSHINLVTEVTTIDSSAVLCCTAFEWACHLLIDCVKSMYSFYEISDM